MVSPYRLDIIENCQICQVRPARLFCALSPETLQAFDAIKCMTSYAQGAVLFVEGQMPSGIFVLCMGRVKMSASGSDGKILVVRIAEPGEVLGLSATMSGKAYELTAETAESCQVNFVKRDHLLRFLKEHNDACFKVAEQLSEKYRVACDEARLLGLKTTADQRVARLLLDWSRQNPECGKTEGCLQLTLTQEEICQLIGTTRETVIRTFAALKKQHILEGKGSSLVILDKSALIEIAGLEPNRGN